MNRRESGMMNAPNTKAFAGHPDSTELYRKLKKNRYLK